MKKLLLPILVVLLFSSCKKQISTENLIGSNSPEKISAGTNTANRQIDVCHREGNGSWHSITISIEGLPAHLAHGDIVPDADGDGYTKETPCGTGSRDDCDDNNASINPGAIEICENNIDDNCNGLVDENCTTVRICDQTWMRKNLDVDTYRDGTPIPEVQDPSAWTSLTTGAWCYYANNSANGTTYGKLYNWYAIAGIWNEESKTNLGIRKQLAPEGWHIPTPAEWSMLEICLGGSSNTGGALKETGTEHWFSPNTGADNSSGFTGLPAGLRSFMGSFFSIGLFSEWWGYIEENTWYATYFYVNAYTGNFYWGGNDKRCGLSVRCVKD